MRETNMEKEDKGMCLFLFKSGVFGEVKKVDYIEVVTWIRKLNNNRPPFLSRKKGNRIRDAFSLNPNEFAHVALPIVDMLEDNLAELNP